MKKSAARFAFIQGAPRSSSRGSGSRSGSSSANKGESWFCTNDEAIRTKPRFRRKAAEVLRLSKVLDWVRMASSSGPNQGAPRSPIRGSGFRSGSSSTNKGESWFCTNDEATRTKPRFRNKGGRGFAFIQGAPRSPIRGSGSRSGSSSASKGESWFCTNDEAIRTKPRFGNKGGRGFAFIQGAPRSPSRGSGSRSGSSSANKGESWFCTNDEAIRTEPRFGNKGGRDFAFIQGP